MTVKKKNSTVAHFICHESDQCKNSAEEWIAMEAMNTLVKVDTMWAWFNWTKKNTFNMGYKQLEKDYIVIITSLENNNEGANKNTAMDDIAKVRIQHHLLWFPAA